MSNTKGTVFEYRKCAIRFYPQLGICISINQSMFHTDDVPRTSIGLSTNIGRKKSSLLYFLEVE